MTKKLFLIDGMAIVYRAYFGFIRNPRINSKGENVSAVFGFIIALMGCYQGYHSGRGAQGVGRATTNAVVTASILILASNYVLTEALFGT